jgi:hypothetical protein
MKRTKIHDFGKLEVIVTHPLDKASWVLEASIQIFQNTTGIPPKPGSKMPPPSMVAFLMAGLENLVIKGVNKNEVDSVKVTFRSQ